jgi:hypothetical protein
LLRHPVCGNADEVIDRELRPNGRETDVTPVCFCAESETARSAAIKRWRQRRRLTAPAVDGAASAPARASNLRRRGGSFVSVGRPLPSKSLHRTRSENIDQTLTLTCQIHSVVLNAPVCTPLASTSIPLAPLAARSQCMVDVRPVAVLLSPETPPSLMVLSAS